jgi:transposase
MRRADEKQGDWKEWRRRRAWELAQQGWSQKQIAVALGATEGAVSQWMKAGREQGVEGLRGKIAIGPSTRITKEQLEQLAVLLEQGAEVHGFQGNVWTTERVAVLIKKQFGVSYHPAHMSRLLKQIRHSVQQPVERATQRDEEAIMTWKEEQWPELKKKLNKKAERSFSWMKQVFICFPCWCVPTHPSGKHLSCGFP